VTSHIHDALTLVEEWRSQYASFDSASSIDVDQGRLASAWSEFSRRLKGSYPFFHPDYAGQMLKPPHPVAVAGYLAAMLVNSNNHALDGGPETSYMEKEVVRDLIKMFGFPVGTSIGHLTSSGTIANLEALWVSREIGSKLVLASEDAHYTHSRMASVIGLPFRSVPADENGRLDIGALTAILEDFGRTCTVVATAGTTGLGNVDPIAEIAALKDEFGFHLHVDAAYGGFFRTLIDAPDVLNIDTRRHFRAIEAADSVVVDPHKHGLQPYGCGAVLFRDASVGRVYSHDSPYTYFTSDDLHLGEISLECSRAGAAAAALWLTLQVLPLTRDGIGGVLSDTRRAATDFSACARRSDILRMAHEPELDIVGYYGRGDARRVDATSQAAFKALMNDDRPLFVSLLKVPGRKLGFEDDGLVRILRSTLMKPEHARHVPYLVQRIERVLEQIES
jgi:glutamate/tyrosine decarboxylase-like PLP-dependent enzyme